MYTDVTQNFVDMINSNVGVLRAKIQIGEQTIENQYIHNVSCEEASCPDVFSMGNLILPKLSFTVSSEAPVSVATAGSKATYYIGLSKTGTEFEYVPVRSMTISKVTRIGEQYTFETKSKFENVDKIYSSDLLFPATSLEVLEEIKALLEIDINTEGVADFFIDTLPIGFTYREVICSIAERSGKNCFISRDDTTLLFKWFESGAEINVHCCDEPEFSTAVTAYSGVSCIKDSKLITSGSAPYFNVCNTLGLMSKESDLAEVMQSLNGLSFYAGKIKMLLGNILYDPWDMLRYESFVIPACSIVHSYDGGLTTEITAPDIENALSDGSEAAKTTQDRAVDRLTIDLIATKELIADKASIAQLNAVKADIEELNVTKQLVINLQSTTNDLENKYTALKADVDGFRSEVSQNITEVSKTADEANAKALEVADKLAGNYSTTVQMNSAIEQTASSITSFVGTTYTTKTEFAALQIGGRNLLSGSDIMFKRTNADTKYTTQSLDVVAGYDLNSLIGQAITLSFFLHSVGERDTSLHASYGNRFGMYLTVRWSDSTGVNADLNRYMCQILTSEKNRERVSITATISPPEGYDTIERVYVSVEIFAKPAADNAETWLLGQPKLEAGNKATDWTPAPEDAQEQITSLSSSYSELSQTVSGINATVVGHTTLISEKADSSTVTEVKSQLTSLSADLDGFRLSVSDEIEAIGERVTSAESSIKQQADLIELKVSKDGVISAINQSAEAVTVDAAKINLNGVVTANQTFRIDTSGSFEATGGTIGGFTVTDNSIRNADDTFGIVSRTDGQRVIGVGGTPESRMLGIFGDGRLIIGEDNSNRLVLNAGNIDFYYGNQKNGRLGQPFGNAPGFEDCDMYLSTNNKYLYGMTAEGTAQRLLGVTAQGNITLGTTTNTGDLYAYTSSEMYFYAGTSRIMAMESNGLRFANDKGVLLNSKIALRYYSNAVYCGADTEPLRLVGSTVTANGTSVTSDRRLKTDIKPISDSYLSLLDRLTAQSYRFTNYRQNVTNCGFIAQDVLAALSEAGLAAEEFGGFVDVYGDGREFALDYSQFVPVLWEAVKKLKAEIDQLKGV